MTSVFWKQAHPYVLSPPPLRPMPTPHLREGHCPTWDSWRTLALPSCLCLPPLPLTLAVTLGNPSVYQKTLLHLSLNIRSLPQAVRVFFTFTPPPTPASKSYFFTVQYSSTSMFFISRIFPDHIPISLHQPGPQGQPHFHLLTQCPLIALAVPPQYPHPPTG